VLSIGSALSARSRWSLLSSDGNHEVLKAPPPRASNTAAGVALLALLATLNHRP
jgi:hypothetical protein